MEGHENENDNASSILSPLYDNDNEAEEEEEDNYNAILAGMGCSNNEGNVDRYIDEVGVEASNSILDSIYFNNKYNARTSSSSNSNTNTNSTSRYLRHRSELTEGTILISNTMTDDDDDDDDDDDGGNTTEGDNITIEADLDATFAVVERMKNRKKKKKNGGEGDGEENSSCNDDKKVEKKKKGDNTRSFLCVLGTAVNDDDDEHIDANTTKKIQDKTTDGDNNDNFILYRINDDDNDETPPPSSRFISNLVGKKRICVDKRTEKKKVGNTAGGSTNDQNDRNHPGIFRSRFVTNNSNFYFSPILPAASGNKNNTISTKDDINDNDTKPENDTKEKDVLHPKLLHSKQNSNDDDDDFDDDDDEYWNATNVYEIYDDDDNNTNISSNDDIINDSDEYHFESLELLSIDNAAARKARKIAKKEKKSSKKRKKKKKKVENDNDAEVENGAKSGNTAKIAGLPSAFYNSDDNDKNTDTDNAGASGENHNTNDDDDTGKGHNDNGTTELISDNVKTSIIIDNKSKNKKNSSFQDDYNYIIQLITGGGDHDYITGSNNDEGCNKNRTIKHPDIKNGIIGNTDTDTDKNNKDIQNGEKDDDDDNDNNDEEATRHTSYEYSREEFNINNMKVVEKSKKKKCNNGRRNRPSNIVIACSLISFASVVCIIVLSFLLWNLNKNNSKEVTVISYDNTNGIDINNDMFEYEQQQILQKYHEDENYYMNDKSSNDVEQNNKKNLEMLPHDETNEVDLIIPVMTEADEFYDGGSDGSKGQHNNHEFINDDESNTASTIAIYRQSRIRTIENVQAAVASFDMLPEGLVNTPTTASSSAIVDEENLYMIGVRKDVSRMNDNHKTAVATSSIPSTTTSPTLPSKNIEQNIYMIGARKKDLTMNNFDTVDVSDKDNEKANTDTSSHTNAIASSMPTYFPTTMSPSLPTAAATLNDDEDSADDVDLDQSNAVRSNNNDGRQQHNVPTQATGSSFLRGRQQYNKNGGWLQHRNDDRSLSSRYN